MSEAAKVYKTAEEALYKEAGDEALAAALEAVKGFKKAGDMAGIADSTRIAATVLMSQDKVSEAMQMVEAELATFKQKGDKSAEAKMLLSQAELLNTEKSEAKREPALDKAEEALNVFQKAKDKKSEAAALLALVDINAKRKVNKATVSSVSQSAEEAVALYKELGDVKGEANALHGVAVSSVLANAYDNAIEVGLEALEMYQQAGIEKKAAFEMQCIASWYLKINKEDEGINYAKQSLAAYRDISAGCNLTGPVASLLVDALLDKEQFEQALKVSKEELQLCREAGDSKRETKALDMIVNCHLRKGDLHHALRRANEAVELQEQAGNKELQGEALRWVCQLQAQRGNSESAFSAADSALQLAEEAGNKEDMARCRQAMMKAAMFSGELDRAAEENEKAQDLMREAGNESGAALFMQEGVEVYVLKDDFQKAIAMARQVCSAFKEDGDSIKEVGALKMLCEVHDRNGDVDAALKSMERCRIINKETGNKIEEGFSLVSIAHLSLALVRTEEERLGTRASRSITQRLDKGYKAAKDAISIGKRLKNDKLKGLAMIIAAQLGLAKGKEKEALLSANDAVQIFRDLGDFTNEATSLNLCANAYLNLGDKERAKEDAEEALLISKTIDFKDGQSFANDILDTVSPKVVAPSLDMAQQMQFQQWQMQQQAGGFKMPQAPGQMSMAMDIPMESQVAKMAGKPSVAGLEGKAVKEKVRALAMEVIGLEPEDLEDDSPLMEVGLTSSASVLLRDAISEAMPGINLPFTLVFDYPSVADLSEHLELKG